MMKIDNNLNATLKNRYRTFPALIGLIIIDLLAVSLSMLVVAFIRNNLLTAMFPAYIDDKLLANTFILFWWYPLAFIVSLAYEKLYHQRQPFWIEVQSIFKSGALTLFLTVTILYLIRIGDEISRLLVIFTWVLAMLLLPLFRYYGKKLLLKLNLWNRPVIVIGNSETIPMIHGAYEREVTMGYRVFGCIYSSGEIEQGLEHYNIPCLGQLAEAPDIIRAAGVEDLVIADPTLPPSELVELTNTLQPLVKYINLVPDLFGLSLSGIEASYFFEEQVVLLQIKNRLRCKISSFFKRVFDLFVGTLISIASLPLMVGIALAVKLDSKGPVFYISKRIGRNDRGFFCIKFRTMLKGCDQILEEYLSTDENARQEWQRFNKLITHDPRVTRVGQILRRLSLDELPQLFNILRGEMSLVGPRPYLPREKEQMGSYANDILVGKPGLTGLWQVSGRNLLSFNSRLRLDSWYMKNWSFWLDLVLLLKTVRVIVKKEGAY